MTYDEIIEQLEITKSKIKEIARSEYGGESWNDDLDALTEAVDIVADYSKATAQASEMSQKYEQPAMAVRRAAGLYTCPLCGKRTQVGHTHCHWCGKKLSWDREAYADRDYPHMSSNRVIIGEVRGAETFELLSALNTGHAGSLSTAHANSVKDMISRLETMVLMGVQLPLEAIRRQIASGIEILVHLGRGEDGSRRVEEIAEITGMEEDEIKTVSLFRREYGRGLQKTGELVHREKLEGKTG